MGVIECVGVAGGTIGANRGARAIADGYTLLVGSTNEMVIASMVHSAVRYDGLKDFTPIGMVAAQPMMLAASKESGIANAAQYLDKLREGKPGGDTLGYLGVGRGFDLAGEWINGEIP